MPRNADEVVVFGAERDEVVEVGVAAGFEGFVVVPASTWVVSKHHDSAYR